MHTHSTDTARACWYEDVTSLFLGHQGNADETLIVPAPSIELLVAAGLPEPGCAWAAQYAKGLSESRTPIGFVRWRKSTIPTVEQLGPYAHTAQPPCVWAVCTPGTDDDSLRLAAEADGVTILCGPGETATVAAYTALKACRQALQPQSNHPPFSVAVMGATPKAANDTFARLAAASDAFLGIALQQGPGAQRLEGTQRTEMRWESAGGPLDTIRAIRKGRTMRPAQEGQSGSRSSSSTRG